MDTFQRLLKHFDIFIIHSSIKNYDSEIFFDSQLFKYKRGNVVFAYTSASITLFLQVAELGNGLLKYLAYMTGI